MMDCEEAVRMVAVWSLVRRERRAEVEGDPWAGVWYDLDQWADLSRVSVTVAEWVARSLCGAMVVRPDGSISDGAAALIVRLELRREFETTFGRPPTEADMERLIAQAKAEEARRNRPT